MDSNLIRIVIVAITMVFLIAWPIIGRKFNLGLPIVVMGGLLGLSAILIWAIAR